jgi:YD repeat-containing protein
MNRILGSLIVLTMMVCGDGFVASAQGPDDCWYWIGVSGPLNPPLGAFDCQCFDGCSCKMWKAGASCAPAAAPPETAPGPGPCPGGCQGGGPINLKTGNTYIEETDARVPDLGGGLTLLRTWNSMWPPTQAAFQTTGLFGLNWRSTYEERVFQGSDDYMKYSRSDGSFWSIAGGSVDAPSSVSGVYLAINPSYTQYVMTFQNGEQRTFSYTSGSLTAITDRNGNTTQLTYDSLNRLTTVTDPGGHHLYFGYQNNSSYLVASVTSDVGISLSYAYDSRGRLTQVTEPDLTTLNYSYDSNSNITSVTDSAGKIIESHTYDSFGRGLTSSRANGVEAITVSYPAP